MLTRVREVEGGYKVTQLHAGGEVESRETADLAQAFAWQADGFPDEVLPEPEAEPIDEPVVPAKRKGRKK